MTAPFFTYSGNVYTGAAAGAVDFPLTSTAGKPIPYLESTHVHVYKSSNAGSTWVELTRPAQWDFTFSGTVARLVTGIASGEWVKVQRITPSSSAYVNFQASSLLTADQLNNESLFNTYLYQEVEDQSDQSTVTAENAVVTANQAVATANAALPLAGGTMTGPIVLPGNPSQPLQSTPKQYVDAADAVLQADINTRWNKSSDTVESTEAWVSSDARVSTTSAADTQFSTIVQPAAPAGNSWPIGKLWYQNDNSKTLNYWTGSQWAGIVSGLPFVEQPSVIYVDSINGDDLNSGNRIVEPKKTIKAAVTAANAGDIIKVTPGVYQESLPIDITVANLSIVGDATRSVFVHPTPATETEIMFRCNSGTYIDGFTFCGLKASGARGDHPIDDDPTYGLPEFQGWVAGFYPGAIIRKSPWIQNSTNFADSGIDNSNFDPNNYSGTGGDTTSAPTGGGVIVDGSLPAVNSPLRSFVINEFTQVCLDGPGLLVCNNGYAQAVSYFGIFNHYQAKALSGGQINMEVGTTNFGRFGLIADGKSTTPIFTATANGAALADAVTFAVNAPTADASWFGGATRPAINMLVKIGSDIYPILTASPNGTGWNVTISRPDPTDRSINLGLINGHSDTDPVEFYLRSMVSTASHTFEYAGSGTNYSALPENGGVPVELNEAVNVNDGRVWLTSTDQTGKFKVGDTFQVDQQTGYVTIDPSSISTNIVSDNSPQLGGDLDVLTRRITTSLGNTGIVIEGNGNGPVTLKSGAADRFVASPTQLTAGFLGTAAAPAYSFIADPDTGLFSTGANELALGTGGNARLTIDASGNVAIPAGLTQGGNNVLTTAGGAVTGDVTLNAQSDLRFADADSSNWVAFQGPATASTNVTWTLPAADGTTGQVLSTDGSGTLSWSAGGGGGASVTTSDTAPSTPADGDLWYDSVGGRLYVYYDDGDTSQWVDAAPQGGAGTAGVSLGLVIGLS
jgi:hypothetical protein